MFVLIVPTPSSAVPVTIAAPFENLATSSFCHMVSREMCVLRTEADLATGAFEVSATIAGFERDHYALTEDAGASLDMTVDHEVASGAQQIAYTADIALDTAQTFALVGSASARIVVGAKHRSDNRCIGVAWLDIDPDPQILMDPISFSPILRCTTVDGTPYDVPAGTVRFSVSVTVMVPGYRSDRAIDRPPLNAASASIKVDRTTITADPS